jgi:hypothetical protein
MATTQSHQNRHEFQQLVERYDEVYEERPYLSGGFFLFFGGVNTKYIKDLVSYKEREVLNMCRCGQSRLSPIHAKEIRILADKLEPEYIY